jgi:hypothetical protein
MSDIAHIREGSALGDEGLREQIIHLVECAKKGDATYAVANALAALFTNHKEAAVLAGQIDAAKHVQQICPTTEGASVERLHHRIDTYLGELQAQQAKLTRRDGDE